MSELIERIKPKEREWWIRFHDKDQIEIVEPSLEPRPRSEGWIKVREIVE